MDDMVERSGKVIWDALLKKGGGGRTLMVWPECPEHDWCLATARDVILAMRKPTQDMLSATVTTHDLGMGASLTLGPYLSIWQIMIDTATKTKESGQ